MFLDELYLGVYSISTRGDEEEVGTVICLHWLDVLDRGGIQ